MAAVLTYGGSSHLFGLNVRAVLNPWNRKPAVDIKSFSIHRLADILNGQAHAVDMVLELGCTVPRLRALGQVAQR